MNRDFNMTALVSGIVFIVLGLLFFFERLGVFDVSSRYVWPIVLVALGVAVLFGGGRRHRWHDHSRHHDHDRHRRDDDRPDDKPPAI